MKYSVKGNIPILDGQEIIKVLNTVNLWKLTHLKYKDITTKIDSFIFEAWVNNESDKTKIFNDLKYFVDNYNGLIAWHKCYHDEPINKSCIIEETYRGV